MGLPLRENLGQASASNMFFFNIRFERIYESETIEVISLMKSFLIFPHLSAMGRWT